MSTREIHRVSSASADFRRAYELLMRPTFPRAELVDLSQLIEEGGHDRNRIWLAVEPSGDLSGVAVVDLYRDAHAPLLSLLSYLAVSAEHRGQGIGGQLLREVLASGELRDGRGMYLEVDDPRVIGADDSAGDPWARLRFYRRFGAKAVNIAYRQPPVRAGSPEVSGMILCWLPEPSDAAQHVDQLDAQHLRAFLERIGASVQIPTGQDTVGLLTLDDVSRIPLSG